MIVPFVLGEIFFLNTGFLGPTPDLPNLYFLGVVLRNLYLRKCSFQGDSDTAASLTRICPNSEAWWSVSGKK